jgi:Flp pilus assembly pilin Flp
MRSFKQLRKDTVGATASEYAFAVGLIALAIIGGVGLTGGSARRLYSEIACSIEVYISCEQEIAMDNSAAAADSAAATNALTAGQNDQYYGSSYYPQEGQYLNQLFGGGATGAQFEAGFDELGVMSTAEGNELVAESAVMQEAAQAEIASAQAVQDFHSGNYAAEATDQAQARADLTSAYGLESAAANTAQANANVWSNEWATQSSNFSGLGMSQSNGGGQINWSSATSSAMASLNSATADQISAQADYGQGNNAAGSSMTNAANQVLASVSQSSAASSAAYYNSLQEAQYAATMMNEASGAQQAVGNSR